jgi:hypothetical protein
MRSHPSGVSPPLNPGSRGLFPQVVSILRSRAVVDLKELLDEMFELGRAKKKAGDKAGYVRIAEERLALAREREGELDYVHFTHVVRDVGMAYQAVKDYEKAVPCLEEAYARTRSEHHDRAKNPKCRFCQVRGNGGRR